MPSIGAPEIIIIAIVIFALFGYRKLPDAARSIGRSMRIFKAETKGLRDDDPVDEEPRQSLPPAKQKVQQGPKVAPPLEHDVKRDSA